MSGARKLSRPPIQEAVIQVHFEGVSLDKAELEALAQPYIGQGWAREEIHTFEATLNQTGGSVEVLAGDATFVGLVLKDPAGVHLIQFRPDSVAVSNARSYESWEALEERTARAFDEFVQVARAAAISRLAARFINRIPAFAEFVTFDQILERPPLTLEGFEGAAVTDFLRRHVVAGLDAGFTANLTIGTVPKEAGEDQDGKPLVIDTDVFKALRVEPVFKALRQELDTLRSIKNRLFFGSLKDEVVEKFL